MNLSLFNLIHGVAGRSSVLDFFGVLFSNYLPYLLALAALIFILMRRSSKERLSIFLTLALSALLARGFITEIIRHFYVHPRPFDALGFTPLIPESGNSFPSGHMTFFFALAMAIWYFNRKWGWWFFGLSALAGVARIFVGVHWPFDIAGGAVLGILSALAVLLVLKPYLPVSLLKKKEAHEEHLPEV